MYHFVISCQLRIKFKIKQCYFDIFLILFVTLGTYSYLFFFFLQNADVPTADVTYPKLTLYQLSKRRSPLRQVVEGDYKTTMVPIILGKAANLLQSSLYQ